MTMTNTELQESAQAFFCLIADKLGKDKTKKLFADYYKKAKIKGDYDVKKKESKAAIAFFEEKGVKEALKKATVTNINTIKTIDEVKSFIITKKDWFISSMKIAEKLLSGVQKLFSTFPNIAAPGLLGIYYAHGDEAVMGTIKELFLTANKNSGNKFGDINKWTPADIYFASKDGKESLKQMVSDIDSKTTLNIPNLNNDIIKLVDGGHLLPISLKMVKKNAILEKVNINMTEQDKLITSIKYKHYTMNLWKSGEVKTIPSLVEIKKQTSEIIKQIGKEFSKKDQNKSDSYREMKIYFDIGGAGTGMSRKEANFQIRHTPASKGRPSAGLKIVLQYAGSSAQHGQLVGIEGLSKTISEVDPQFGGDLKTEFYKRYEIYKTAANTFIDEHGGSAMYNSKGPEAPKEKLKFNTIIGALSANFLMDPFRKKIADYFNESRNKRRKIIKGLGASRSKNDRVFQEIFTYASSRSPGAAPFLVAKD